MYTEILAKRAAEDRPIRVGIVGAGKFGSGFIAQIAQMRGMVTSVIADVNIDRARQVYAACGVPLEKQQVVQNLSQLNDAIRQGKPAIVEDALLITQAEGIEVICEVTGIPEIGARIAYEAITNRKHVVMVNVEADVTVGPILRRLADAAGVVYTLVDGDQPGCITNMIDWAKSLGFEIVAAGRGTVFYGDDRQGTPDTVPQRFGLDAEMLKQRPINLKMYNSFRDGTKAQVEMAALSNATGLPPDLRGMHEPSVNVEEIAKRFSVKEEGGLLNRSGVVELANSIAADGKTMLPNPLKMGVFVVMRTEHPFIIEDLSIYHKMPCSDNGKNFVLWRPYHLVAVEAPISIALAAGMGVATGSTLPTPTAEVITVAKNNLEEGETLDGGGGYTVNGICERADIARKERLLPLGLAVGAKLKQDVAQGQAITYDMVELPTDSFIYKLRQLQDATVWTS